MPALDIVYSGFPAFERGPVHPLLSGLPKAPVVKVVLFPTHWKYRLYIRNTYAIQKGLLEKTD